MPRPPVRSSQIVGPALFGLTYMKTAGTYPKTIFFMSAASIAISFVFVSFVRLPPVAPPRDLEGAVRPGVDRERTLIGGGESADSDEEGGGGKLPKALVTP